MMRASHRELLALAKKSARGLGFDHGQAEELGPAVCWLHHQGCDGLGALLACAPRSEQADWSRRAGGGPGFGGGPLRLVGVSAGSDGPVLVDLLLVHRPAEGPRSSVEPELWLDRLDSPLLLVGLLGVRAQDHHVGFEIGPHSYERALPGNGPAAGRAEPDHRVDRDGESDQAGTLGQWLTDHLNSGHSLQVRGPQALTGERSHRPETVVEVGEARWRQAQALAARTYVPSNEHSRHHGAGAGLTDND